MNFSDAVVNLVNGKKMMRQKWGGYYILLINGQSYIWQIGSINIKSDPNVVVYIPSIDDILAQDWFIKN